MNQVLGKDYESRQLSKKVRDLALAEIGAILEGKKKVEKRFRQALILKLAGTVLPRLNEHSGEGGEPISFKLINYADPSTPVQPETLPDTPPESI